MLTVYSQPNCPFCVKAKTYLSDNDIEFQEINIKEDKAAYTFIKSKHDTVPQLYFGDELMIRGGWTGLNAVKPELFKQLVESRTK